MTNIAEKVEIRIQWVEILEDSLKIALLCCPVTRVCRPTMLSESVRRVVVAILTCQRDGLLVDWDISGYKHLSVTPFRAVCLAILPGHGLLSMNIKLD